MRSAPLACNFFNSDLCRSSLAARVVRGRGRPSRARIRDESQTFGFVVRGRGNRRSGGVLVEPISTNDVSTLSVPAFRAGTGRPADRRAIPRRRRVQRVSDAAQCHAAGRLPATSRQLSSAGWFPGDQSFSAAGPKFPADDAAGPRAVASRSAAKINQSGDVTSRRARLD